MAEIPVPLTFSNRVCRIQSLAQDLWTIDPPVALGHGPLEFSEGMGRLGNSLLKDDFLTRVGEASNGLGRESRRLCDRVHITVLSLRFPQAGAGRGGSRL